MKPYNIIIHYLVFVYNQTSRYLHFIEMKKPCLKMISTFQYNDVCTYSSKKYTSDKIVKCVLSSVAK